jgi:hypothetical protein
MKKTILLLLFLYITNSKSFAQIQPNFNLIDFLSEDASNSTYPASIIQESQLPNIAGFHFGVRYQPFLSKMNFISQTNSRIIPDETINQGWGASLNYYGSNYFAIHVEIINQRQKFSFRDAGFQNTVDLNYVNMPILASLNSNYGRAINVNVAAGPYLGFNTNVQTTTNGQANGKGTPILIANPLDFGAAYGAGLDFAFGTGSWLHLNLGYRGTLGFTNIKDSNIILDETQYSIIGKNARNRTNGLYVGIMAKF